MFENKALLTDEELDALTMHHILEAYGARARLNKLMSYLSDKELEASVYIRTILSILEEADSEEIGMV